LLAIFSLEVKNDFSEPIEFYFERVKEIEGYDLDNGKFPSVNETVLLRLLASMPAEAVEHFSKPADGAIELAEEGGKREYVDFEQHKETVEKDAKQSIDDILEALEARAKSFVNPYTSAGMSYYRMKYMKGKETRDAGVLEEAKKKNESDYFNFEQLVETFRDYLTNEVAPQFEWSRDVSRYLKGMTEATKKGKEGRVRALLKSTQKVRTEFWLNEDKLLNENAMKRRDEATKAKEAACESQMSAEIRAKEAEERAKHAIESECKALENERKADAAREAAVENQRIAENARKDAERAHKLTQEREAQARKAEEDAQKAATAAEEKARALQKTLDNLTAAANHQEASGNDVDWFKSELPATSE